MAQKKKSSGKTVAAKAGSAKAAAAPRAPHRAAAKKAAAPPSRKSPVSKAPEKARAKAAAVETQRKVKAKVVEKAAQPVKPVAKAPQAKAPAAKPVAPAPVARVVTPTSVAAEALARARMASPATPKEIAEKAAAARAAPEQKKAVSARHGFKMNEFVVYPTRGVGRIIAIEEQEIAGIKLELIVINFEKDKLTLRVPTGKISSVGMRKLSDEGIVGRAMDTLKGKARIKRTMWSRRAQEYEAKINSGDLVSIAEVVRDLYRSESQPEQSYSERQLYEAALDRMAREIAVVDRIDERGAVQRITEVLSRSAKSRKMAQEQADAAASKAA